MLDRRRVTLSVWNSSCTGFAMKEDEPAEDMFDRLMVIVNKIRSYGSEDWGDQEVVKILLRAYSPRDSHLVSIIRFLGDLKPFTPNNILEAFLCRELDPRKVMEERLEDVDDRFKELNLLKIDILQRQLHQFVMEEDELVEEMFDRLMVIVKKIRAYDSEDWGDHKVVRILLTAYSQRDITLVTVIRWCEDFKDQTPYGVLGTILRHELFREEEQPLQAKDSAKQGSSSKTKEVASKASKKSKSKDFKEDSSNKDESTDSDEDLALLMSQFMKLMKKKGIYKKKNDKSKIRKSNRPCYSCGEVGHFKADCPHEEEEKKKEKVHRKGGKSSMGEARIREEWDSNEESSDSEDEGDASIAATRTAPSHKSLFGDLDDDKGIRHFCLTAIRKEIPKE